MAGDSALARLRAALDREVAGHEDAKTGLILAWLAGEHAYLEGPPGCAKSLLAEAFLRAVGGRAALLRCHRDMREWDLLGATQLQRRAVAGGERLRRTLAPGPLLQAELAVLDDLARAPGEALGLLGPILGARRIAGRALPLGTAIATGLPAELEAYTDPLEPAQLDRFAIQVRMAGTLSSRSWPLARQLLDFVPSAAGSAVLDAAERRALRERAARLRVPRDVRRALVEVAVRLTALVPAGELAPLSDRSFTRAALGILRAHALLRGATYVETEDLRALRYMLACRLPPGVQARLDEVLAGVLYDEPPVLVPAAARRGERAGAGSEAAVRPVPVPAGQVSEAHLASRSAAARTGAEADAAAILRALEGQVERARVDRREDPGGSPRRYRALRQLDEIFDADPVESLLYLDGSLPGGLRSFARERRRAGGHVVLLRDVSASMEGRLSRWAGVVMAGLVRAAARWRMRLGYVEFNHQAQRYDAAGRFFHRRYGALLALAADARAEGRTNYEAPLALALGELRRTPGRDRHVVLLTDGVPVLGDPEVRRERALARRLGVRVHTVFVGLGEVPGVLDALARETGGLALRARLGARGPLRVEAGPSAA